MKRTSRESVADRLSAICQEHGLGPEVRSKLSLILEGLAGEHAPTAVSEPSEAVDVHIADALSGLEVPEILDTDILIADLGSGCGVPGLPLAAALPMASVIAVEASGRRCDFITAVAANAGIPNITATKARAEEWTDGLGTCDVVIARALAPLPVIVEYAAPLLKPGGALVAWKGSPSEDELNSGARAADLTGLEVLESAAVTPWPAGGQRQLIRMRKVAETPHRFPRRAGVAAKRPLGGN